MSETGFEGVIFDFNGVLLWDNPLHEEAWRQFSARLRGYPMSLEEMQLAVHGRVNRDIFEYVLGRAVADDELEPLIAEKEAIYRQLALDSLDTYRLSPGAVELLDFLVENGFSRAIATSSPQVNIDFFVKQLDLHRWFTPETIIYDRGQYPGKPAPDIYLEAAARLGSSPAKFIVVEDAVAGIQSACAAGIGAIIAIGPAESHAKMANFDCVRVVIENLGEFPRSLLAQHNAAARPHVSPR
jgi:HAD superfamily hydrolase (TIGR01509 family)